MKPLEPNRFAAYKKSIDGAQTTRGFITHLTWKEAHDEKRFPLGKQKDSVGYFVWVVGANNGVKF